MLAALPFLARGLLRVRSRRLGGRAAGGTVSSRLYRVSQGDDVDVHCAQYFVHSSLSPVLLFRRRLKSVADVLKGIKSKGFTQSRWDSSGSPWLRGGPISSLRPWDDLIPPDLHGFFKWVFDSLEVLNGFLRQVVVSQDLVGLGQKKSTADAEFRNAWMVSVGLILELQIKFLDFVGHLLPQEPFLDLPRIWSGSARGLVLKSLLLVGWMVGAWNKALPLP